MAARSKKSKRPSRDEGEPVAHVPAEVVVDQAHDLAEVVAVFFGENDGVRVEHDPVDDPLHAGLPRLVCQRCRTPIRTASRSSAISVLGEVTQLASPDRRA